MRILDLRISSFFFGLGLTLWLSLSAEAGKFNRVLSVGDAAPEWNDLPGVDDDRHALADLAEARLVVLVFTCNHCPVAQAYEDRLLALARDREEQGVRLVAISCSPRESDKLPAMKERARSKGYTFEYLHDSAQTTPRAYGVRKTPTVFVLGPDRTVAYMGAIDDSWRDAANVEHDYLRVAVDALLAGRKPRVVETKPDGGCELEYKKK